LWGAERIRGELLKLGIRIAKRTVQKYMRSERQFGPHRGQSWRTFLRNHTLWACDFLQTYDIWFRPIFAFFIVDQHTKRVVHLAVTRAPSQGWTAQQLCNATPFGVGPHVLVRDRDDKFGADFDRVATGVGIRVVRTAVRAPLMNSVCERFVGSVRRECLDHVIVLGEHTCSASSKSTRSAISTWPDFTRGWRSRHRFQPSAVRSLAAQRSWLSRFSVASITTTSSRRKSRACK